MNPKRRQPKRIHWFLEIHRRLSKYNATLATHATPKNPYIFVIIKNGVARVARVARALRP
jgi:hypothetical protein